jgi:hypothetical protein
VAVSPNLWDIDSTAAMMEDIIKPATVAPYDPYRQP